MTVIWSAAALLVLFWLAAYGMSYLVDRNVCRRELLEFLEQYGKKEAAV